MKKLLFLIVLFFFVFINIFKFVAYADITEWTALTPGADTGIKFGNSTVRSIAYGGDKFVAVGNNGKASYSTDGISWITLPAGADTGIKFGTEFGATGVAYGNGKFIAVGQNRASYSTDGISWTVMTPPISVPYAITYGSDKFVVVGENGTSAYSSADGLSWTTLTPGVNTGIKTGSTAAYTVTYGNGKFVTAGWDGKASYSTDGISWTALTPGADTGIKFGTTPITGVYYGNDKFVAVGWSGKASYSPDGISWTALTPGADTGIKFGTTHVYGVHYGNDKFVAVGWSGKASYSTDGISWTALTPGADTGIKFGTTNLQAVAFGNGKFVAVGDSGKASYTTEFIPTPTPSPIPSPTPTSSPSNTNSSESSQNSSPNCSANAIASAPDLYQVDSSNTSATLYFTPVANSSTYYVSYGTTNSSDSYAVSFSHSDTSGAVKFSVNSLNSNTTYYFKVRGGNECFSGAWSNSKSITTGASNINTGFFSEPIFSQDDVVQVVNKAAQKAATIPIVEKTVDRKIEVTKTTTKNKESIISYVVKTGDSLWGIAQDVLGAGSEYAKIIEQNIKKYPELASNLQIGTELQIEKEEPPIEDKKTSQKLYGLDVRILASNNKPLEGVAVTIHSTPRTEVTNKDGIARFKNVEGGKHKVYLAYEGYDGGGQSISITGDKKDIELVMQVELQERFASPVTIGIIVILVFIIAILVFLLYRKTKFKKE